MSSPTVAVWRWKLTSTVSYDTTVLSLSKAQTALPLSRCRVSLCLWPSLPHLPPPSRPPLPTSVGRLGQELWAGRLEVMALWPVKAGTRTSLRRLPMLLSRSRGATSTPLPSQTPMISSSFPRSWKKKSGRSSSNSNSSYRHTASKHTTTRILQTTSSHPSDSCSPQLESVCFTQDHRVSVNELSIKFTPRPQNTLTRL